MENHKELVDDSDMGSFARRRHFKLSYLQMGNQRRSVGKWGIKLPILCSSKTATPCEKLALAARQ